MIGVSLESKLKSLHSHKASTLPVNGGSCALRVEVVKRRGGGKGDMLSCKPLLCSTMNFERKIVKLLLLLAHMNVPTSDAVIKCVTVADVGIIFFDYGFHV